MKAETTVARYFVISSHNSFCSIGHPKIPKDDIEAALKMDDSKSFTLAEMEMRTGVKRPTLYLYLNRRKNGGI